MIRIPKVTMTMRELDRLKCIQGLIDGQLKQHAVATRLGLTTRQVRRLVRQYEQQGPVGLIWKLRNRPSNRRLKSAVADHAFGILRSSTFAYFEATHKYLERYGKPLAFYSDANTPAAKGRVERAHQTLQDRLVKELRLQRISTVDAANVLYAELHR